MATSPAGNPYVESSDLVANYPATSLALANRLDKYAVNPFADAAARDAAIPTPVQGQLAQTLDDNKVWRYDGTAWAPFSGAVGAASFTNTPTGSYTDAGIDYEYITFTGTGNFGIDVAGFATILAVGGGAGGGSSNISGYAAGGGGAGQVFEYEVYLSVQAMTVIIGAGGAGGASTGSFDGAAGFPSSIGFYLSSGGGGGGSRSNAGLNGASGGGGGGSNASAGGSAFSPMTGRDGAAGVSNAVGGGGGGSSTAGSGVTGGAGTSSSLTNVATTFGAGGDSTGNANAAANTGNGGQGSIVNGATGGAGGSGIVTIRVVV